MKILILNRVAILTRRATHRSAVGAVVVAAALGSSIGLGTGGTAQRATAGAI
jgi:hypothetical protein